MPKKKCENNDIPSIKFLKKLKSRMITCGSLSNWNSNAKAAAALCKSFDALCAADASTPRESWEELARNFLLDFAREWIAQSGMPWTATRKGGMPDEVYLVEAGRRFLCDALMPAGSVPALLQPRMSDDDFTQELGRRSTPEGEDPRDTLLAVAASIGDRNFGSVTFGDFRKWSTSRLLDFLEKEGHPMDAEPAKNLRAVLNGPLGQAAEAVIRQQLIQAAELVRERKKAELASFSSLEKKVKEMTKEAGLNSDHPLFDNSDEDEPVVDPLFRSRIKTLLPEGVHPSKLPCFAKPLEPAFRQQFTFQEKLTQPEDRLQDSNFEVRETLYAIAKDLDSTRCRRFCMQTASQSEGVIIRVFEARQSPSAGGGPIIECDWLYGRKDQMDKQQIDAMGSVMGFDEEDAVTGDDPSDRTMKSMTINLGEVELLRNFLRLHRDMVDPDYRRERERRTARGVRCSVLAPIPATPPKPFASCAVCGKQNGKLSHCAKCGVTQYCGRECQKSDWPTHKKACASRGLSDDARPAIVDAMRLPWQLEQMLATSGDAHFSSISMNQSTLGGGFERNAFSRNIGAMRGVPEPLRGTDAIVKVQVPMNSSVRNGQALQVSDKDRRLVLFVCLENCKEAASLEDAVHQKGDKGGLRAFYMASFGADGKEVRIAFRNGPLPPQPW